MASNFGTHFQWAYRRFSDVVTATVAADYKHKRCLADEAGHPEAESDDWCYETDGVAKFLVLWRDGERFKVYRMDREQGYINGIAEPGIPPGLRPIYPQDGAIPGRTQMVLFPRH